MPADDSVEEEHSRTQCVVCVTRRTEQNNRVTEKYANYYSRTTYRNVKDLAFPSAAGIAPEMLLLDRSKLNSFSSCPSSGARVPDKFRFSRSLSNIMKMQFRANKYRNDRFCKMFLHSSTKL